MSRALDFDAEARLTAEEALAHPWICGEEKSLALINEDPIHDQLRVVQEMVQNAKRMFFVRNGHGSNPLESLGHSTKRDERETGMGLRYGSGASEKESRYGSVTIDNLIPTSPASIVSEKEQLKKRNGVGGMLMMGMSKSMTQGYTQGYTHSNSPGGFSSLSAPRGSEATSSYGSSIDDPVGQTSPDGKSFKRRGKLRVARNFAVEDGFANDGDWV